MSETNFNQQNQSTQLNNYKIPTLNKMDSDILTIQMIPDSLENSDELNNNQYKQGLQINEKSAKIQQNSENNKLHQIESFKKISENYNQQNNFDNIKQSYIQQYNNITNGNSDTNYIFNLQNQANFDQNKMIQQNVANDQYQQCNFDSKQKKSFETNNNKALQNNSNKFLEDQILQNQSFNLNLNNDQFTEDIYSENNDDNDNDKTPIQKIIIEKKISKQKSSFNKQSQQKKTTKLQKKFDQQYMEDQFNIKENNNLIQYETVNNKIKQLQENKNNLSSNNNNNNNNENQKSNIINSNIKSNLSQQQIESQNKITQEQIVEDDCYLSQKKTVTKVTTGSNKNSVLEQVKLTKFNKKDKQYEFSCYKDEHLGFAQEFGGEIIGHSSDDDVETDEEVFGYGTRYAYRELRKAICTYNEEFDPQQYPLQIHRIRPELQKNQEPQK